jgi:hypothetical protein
VLWILGDLVGLPFLAAQLIHMMREDASDAAQIDAELDAQEAELESNKAAALSSAASPAEAEVADDHEPLWWETDPRFTSRFKSAD